MLTTSFLADQSRSASARYCFRPSPSVPRPLDFTITPWTVLHVTHHWLGMAQTGRGRDIPEDVSVVEITRAFHLT